MANLIRSRSAGDVRAPQQIQPGGPPQLARSKSSDQLSRPNPQAFQAQPGQNAIGQQQLQPLQLAMQQGAVNPQAVQLPLPAQIQVAPQLAPLPGAVTQSLTRAPFANLAAGAVQPLVQAHGEAAVLTALDKINTIVSAKNAPDQPVLEPLRMLNEVLANQGNLPFLGQPVVTGFQNSPNGVALPTIQWRNDAPTNDPFTFQGAEAPQANRTFANPDQMGDVLAFLKTAVPRTNVNDGCDGRCIYTAAVLEETMGFRTGKIKIRTTDDSLFSQTPPFPARNVDQPPTAASNPAWKMHTATIVYDAQDTPWVLDVSLPAPISLADWKQNLTHGKAEGVLDVRQAVGWKPEVNGAQGDQVRLQDSLKDLRGLYLFETVDHNEPGRKDAGWGQWVIDGPMVNGMVFVQEAPQVARNPVVTGWAQGVPTVERVTDADLGTRQLVRIQAGDQTLHMDLRLANRNRDLFDNLDIGGRTGVFKQTTLATLAPHLEE